MAKPHDPEGTKKKSGHVKAQLTYAYIRKIKKWMFCPACQHGKMTINKASTNEVLQSDLSKFTQDKTQKVIELILNTADRLVSEHANPVHIENKIVLSIAIRQKAERYMVNRISNDEIVNAIKTNQTRELRNLITINRNSPKDIKIEEILERVLIITSENIHLNSFMYEPIIDMSLELIKLYADVNVFLI